jgi:hypothetical protein
MPKVDASKFKFKNYTSYYNAYIIPDDSYGHARPIGSIIDNDDCMDTSVLVKALTSHLHVCKMVAGVIKSSCKKRSNTHTVYILARDGHYSNALEDASVIDKFTAAKLKQVVNLCYIKEASLCRVNNIDDAANTATKIAEWIVNTNTAAIDDIKNGKEEVIIAIIGGTLNNTKYASMGINIVPLQKRDRVCICNQCGGVLTDVELHHVLSLCNACRHDIAIFATPDTDEVLFSFGTEADRKDIFLALAGVCQFRVDREGSITVDKWVKSAYDTWKSTLSNTISLAEYMALVAKDNRK